jgi:hypothetical protein
LTYVLDSNSLGVLKNFYPETFPTLWEEIDTMVSEGDLVSVEEVLNEAMGRIDSDHIVEWIEANRSIFAPPTEADMVFVAEIFEVRHFEQLVSQDKLLRGGHLADPWLIARAKNSGGVVITEEKLKPNAAKIPNVCDHFGIQWTNVEGLLRTKGWRY